MWKADGRDILLKLYFLGVSDDAAVNGWVQVCVNVNVVGWFEVGIIGRGRSWRVLCLCKVYYFVITCTRSYDATCIRVGKRM